MAAAGLTGGRVNKFNIPKQSKDYDANGDYIKTWVPELAKVPAHRIHEPWLMSKDEQTKFSVDIGTDYPEPKRSRAGGGGGGGGGKGKGKGGRGGGYSGGAVRGGRDVRSGGKGWGRPY